LKSEGAGAGGRAAVGGEGQRYGELRGRSASTEVDFDGDWGIGCGREDKPRLGSAIAGKELNATHAATNMDLFPVSLKNSCVIAAKPESTFLSDSDRFCRREILSQPGMPDASRAVTV